MINEALAIGLRGDGTPHVSFKPRAGVDFEELDVAIPPLVKRSGQLTLDELLNPDVVRDPTIQGFRDELTVHIRKHCGSTACAGEAHVYAASLVNVPDELQLTEASIYCESKECPLIDPPTSGDREPRLPLPPAPSLEATADALNA